MALFILPLLCDLLFSLPLAFVRSFVCFALLRFVSCDVAEMYINYMVELKCLATIASIYWKSNEESVEGDRPLRTPYSSPIESRESIPASSSKADRVQGSNLI